MSNKYNDLVKIIQKSRENIRPALQGNIYEREMLGSQILSEEEAKIRALEEIKQRPKVKIIDEDKPTPIVEEEEFEEEEVKEEEVKEEEGEEELTEEELEDKLENHALDISGLQLIPKNSVKKMRQSGVGKKYYIREGDDIKIYKKLNKSGVKASPNIDELILTIPITRGKILYDVGIKNVFRFVSLLRKGPVKTKLNQQIDQYVNTRVEGVTGVVGGTGHDPRLLIGSFLAKNNNKQLEKLIMNIFSKKKSFY